MSNFYTDVIQKSPNFNSVQRIDDINLLEPNTRQRVLAVIADAKAQGTPLMVYETYRSQARQEALFQQKVTQLQTVGVHHYGLACDIVKIVNGEPSWQGDYTFLEPLAKKHDLIWGGNWGYPDPFKGFQDLDHVQFCSLKRQSTLFQGMWYPDQTYNPYQD
jgi:hypothetical protein